MIGCAPCEEGNRVSTLHTKRVQVQVRQIFSNREVSQNSIYCFFVRKNYEYSSVILVLFCWVFVQSTMHTSLLVIQDRLQGTTPLFFWLNPCQVLLSFRAVQVKQLAFLASFLSDLFRRLATLSCRVWILQRFQVCNMGRVEKMEKANEFTPAKQMLVLIFLTFYIFEFSLYGNDKWDPKPPSSKTAAIVFHFSTAMFDDRRLFPCGFFCLDFLFFQLCLGWHLLLEAPLLLPQAMEMEMDRDPISITACTSQHYLNHEFLSQINPFVCADTCWTSQCLTGLDLFCSKTAVSQWHFPSEAASVNQIRIDVHLTTVVSISAFQHAH